MPKGFHGPLWLLAASAWICFLATPRAEAQPDAASVQPVRRGYLLDVPVPLTDAASTALARRLADYAEMAPEDGRLTIVLHYPPEAEGGADTAFESSLRLARLITSPTLRRLKVVSWVEGSLEGHSVLPLLASELLLVGPSASIGDAGAGESSLDETVGLSYRAIAQRRAIFPEPVVAALVDRNLELAWVTTIDGGREFFAGEALAEIRAGGNVLQEEIWSPSGVPLRLETERLRASRIAARVVTSAEEVAEVLDLAELRPTDLEGRGEPTAAAMLEIVGSIASNRARRWQSNLSATVESGEVDTWFVVLDSSGGSLAESASLAAWFSQPTPPVQTVAGVIRGEARGDAALLALACKPLFMTSASTLGGPGADAMTSVDVARHEEVIQQVARETRRPEGLIRGLLDRDLAVYRFTDRRTGRITYSTEDDLFGDAEDPEQERERWERGERIDLSEGLSPEQAIELGLAEGTVESLVDAAGKLGLPDVPEAISDRALVHFVEQIGRNNTLAFFLLFLGFVMLSSEASAPGLGVPGFIAMVCFACFFWIKFLAGTAEWLELLAFALGLICIAIELFVLPGFGIFGIGGLVLTMLGVILMSQTFVIPRNVYQMEVVTRGIWLALGGFGGMLAGLFLIRTMLPHVPLFRGLVMEMPDAAVDELRERLGNFDHLVGQLGQSTTPLLPSGKARFGDEVVAVVSDGSPVSAGQSVRVLEVHGNRIIVEAVET